MKVPLRIEDLLLGGWVAVASPLLFRFGGDKGPFDGGQPIEGVLCLAAVLGLAVCVSARRPAEPGSSNARSILTWGSVGPLVGGVLLVAIAGFTALDAGSQTVGLILLAGVGVAVAARFALPPLPVAVRRALVSPFVAVASGLYWSAIAALTAGNGFVITPSQVVHDPHTVELVAGFLAAFSAVYYAMLIYAPRQVVAPEGGIAVWLLRYAVFVVSILLGIGWLGLLGT